MAPFAEYRDLDGVGLAELIQKGEVSAAEVCESAIEQIEKVNPRINAVITPMFEIGRQQAGDSRRQEGPFAGVPFLLKDLVEVYGGVRLTMGSRSCVQYVPPHDSEMVSRFKSAGLTFLGKTNVPEFGLMAATEPELFGPCRNPWNLEHTPGGSSGGSAAAVASGMVPVASANDGGGSIRIPASCCGLVGLKPSRGRTPTGPILGELWQGAALSHAVSRTVRDSAALLDAVHGAEPGSPYLIEAPARPYLEEVTAEPGSLRIAFNTRSPIGTPVHPECVRAVEEAARLLESLGHKVEEAAPEINGHAFLRSFLAIIFGEVGAMLSTLPRTMGRKPRPSDVEPLTWTMGLLGRKMTATDFARAKHMWGMTAREMGRFHQKYDLYLTPTIASPPVRIGEFKPKKFEQVVLKTVNKTGIAGIIKATGVIDKLAIDLFQKIPFTPLANATGQPAMSVPLHWSPDGLPCGVQFMARLGGEDLLFRVAGQLERAKPWSGKRPPVWTE